MIDEKGFAREDILLTYMSFFICDFELSWYDKIFIICVFYAL